MTKKSDAGQHNDNFPEAQTRLMRGRTYKDLSTICIIPTRGIVSVRVLQSWFNLMAPMNQKFLRMFVQGDEVGQAYNNAIEAILADKHLSTWKYILTLEEDNAPPPDGLLKLYESMDKFSVVAGLYWTKGEGGQPMIYGNPGVMPKDFVPQLPLPDSVQECNGLGMGFNLFRLDMFKKLEKPWFKTLQEYTPGVGMRTYTQDLYFYERAAMHGHRFACDTRVKVGHYDANQDVMW